MSDDPLYDPDDPEALEAMHAEAREFMAASSLDAEQSRNLIAALLGFNREVAETLDGFAMILRRIEGSREMVAENLETIVEQMKRLTVHEKEEAAE